MKYLVQDLSRLSQRKIIKETVETYPYDWIVIHETLQNSLDAIQRSRKAQGKIKISMDLDRRQVEIWDNGIGFPFNLSLLGFGGSDKTSTDWTMGGEIGVGLKVVIFSIDKLDLESTFLDEGTGALREWRCRIRDSHKYLSGELDDVHVDFDEPTPTKNAETYTKLTYIFPDEKVMHFVQGVYYEYIIPKMIHDDIASSSVDKFKLALEHYFRTRGYSANVNNLLGIEQTVPTEISLSISCKEDSSLKRLDEGLRQIFQTNPAVQVVFKNSFWDVEEAIGHAKRGLSRPTILKTPFPDEGGHIGNYNKNFIYVQKFTDWNSFWKLLRNTHMRNPPDPTAYENFFNQYVMGAYLVVGSREVLPKYLIGIPRMHLIAASGIPSTHDIYTPRDVGDLGYVNNIHFIVNLRIRLTYGKQTVKNPRLIGKVNDFFRDAFRSVLKYTAENITGKVESPPYPIVVPSAEVVSRPMLGLPELTIKKIPIEEIEVIALFYELVGRGYFKEYETWALTLRETYDGKMIIHYAGISMPVPKSDNDLSILEFKTQISDLIDDFDGGRKNPEDIRLIVVWEDDFSREFPQGHMNFEVISAMGTEVEKYCLPYVEKCLHDRRSARKIQIVELKHVVEELKKLKKA